MQYYFFCLCVIFFTITVKNAIGVENPGLRAELLRMSQLDQEVRQEFERGDIRNWRKVNDSNRERLKTIVGNHGWPTIKMVGEDGARAAALMALHADRDKEFQISVLHLLEPLIQKGEAFGKDYAYLYDRTHMPQRFGTQGTCVSRGEWLPFEIEDISQVGERRKVVGLPPLRDYAKLFVDLCASPKIPISKSENQPRTVPIPED